MATNKVIYGNTTLIDLTSDTATTDKVLSGYTFHNAAGVQQTGTSSAIVPSGTTSITQNGTYDVTNYASAVVNVAGSGDAPPLLKLVGKKEKNDYLGTDSYAFTPPEIGNYLIFGVSVGQNANPWNISQGCSLTSSDGDVGTMLYHDVESSCGCLIYAFRKSFVGTDTITLYFSGGGGQVATSSAIYVFEDAFDKIDHLPAVWNYGYTASSNISTRTSTLTDYTNSSSALFGFTIIRGSNSQMASELTDAIYEDIYTEKNANMPLQNKDTNSSWGLGIGLFYPKLCGDNKAVTVSAICRGNTVATKVITFY